MATALAAGVVAIGVFAGCASGFEFRARFVHRVGTTDFPMNGWYEVEAAPGSRLRVRLQVGVFDDADGPAPAGGVLGWNVGAIS